MLISHSWKPDMGKQKSYKPKFRNPHVISSVRGQCSVIRCAKYEWGTRNSAGMILLKRKFRYFDQIIVTGCTWSCQNNNFLYR